jgi:hypothetical protein
MAYPATQTGSPFARNGRARLSLRRPAIRADLTDFTDPSGEFDLLCAAYEEACIALDGWRRSASDVAETRVSEYQKLVDELELDLTQIVSAQGLTSKSLKRSL